MPRDVDMDIDVDMGGSELALQIVRSGLIDATRQNSARPRARLGRERKPMINRTKRAPKPCRFMAFRSGCGWRPMMHARSVYPIR
jgi:hypothetical protein